MRTPIALALALAGCTSAAPPPLTPSPADIASLAAVVDSGGIPPQDYLTYGTTLAVRNCVGWYTDQIIAASKNANLAGNLALLGTVAGMAGTFAAGPAAPAAAAATSFGGAALANQQANALAGADPVLSYGLTRKVQQAWLAAAPMPTTAPQAYMLVEDFAEKCQLPDIKGAIAAAVSTAPVRAVPMSGAAAFGLLPEPRRPLLPPTIVIGNGAS